MNKQIIIIFMLPILLFLLAISMFFIIPIINDIDLGSFGSQLEKKPLPENTSIVETKLKCGKLNGNGNGMDFFACILVKSNLSQNELKSYYSQMKFRPAKLGFDVLNHSVDFDVLQMQGETLASDYVEIEDLTFDSLKNVQDFSKYYVVLIYDGGYSAAFDLRGH